MSPADCRGEGFNRTVTPLGIYVVGWSVGAKQSWKRGAMLCAATDTICMSRWKNNGRLESHTHMRTQHARTHMVVSSKVLGVTDNACPLWGQNCACHKTGSRC